MRGSYAAGATQAAALRDHCCAHASPSLCAFHTAAAKFPEQSLLVHSLHTAHLGWGTLKVLHGYEMDKLAVVALLLRKLLLLEQLPQIFGGFGFTVTGFTFSVVYRS